MTGDPPAPAKAPHQVEYGELPELARGLRAMGSSRRQAGAVQSLFFRPLLEARRKAEEARSALARLKAFDAPELARGLDRCVERIVADCPDARDAARRAVRAGLEERLGEYRASLATMSQAAAVVRAAGPDTLLAAWREWTARLQHVFLCADRSWLSIQPVVESLTARKPR